MTSNQSPFASFYDDIFANTSQEEQEIFLRQLFTMDGNLCSRYYNYINFFSIDQPIKNVIGSAMEEAVAIRKKIIAYDWEDLWQTVPGAPEDYIEDVWKILQKEFLSDVLLLIKSHFSCGDILMALKKMRILELSLDFDWEKDLTEPACYYQNEINYIEIESEFNFAHAYFDDSIFSVEILNIAQDLILNFINNPMTYFPHTKSWKELLEAIDDRMKKLK